MKAKLASLLEDLGKLKALEQVKSQESSKLAKAHYDQQFAFRE